MSYKKSGNRRNRGEFQGRGGRGTLEVFFCGFEEGRGLKLKTTELCGVTTEAKVVPVELKHATLRAFTVLHSEGERRVAEDGQDRRRRRRGGCSRTTSGDGVTWDSARTHLHRRRSRLASPLTPGIHDSKNKLFCPISSLVYRFRGLFKIHFRVLSACLDLREQLSYSCSLL